MAATAIAAAASLAAASAADETFHVELNRLEERAGGCRIHLVIENAAARAYASYQLDLVIFAADGIIARRVALEAAPLRARKTMVKEFDLENLACADIGRILLNDIPSCTADGGDAGDCVAATRTSSRTSVSFVK